MNLILVRHGENEIYRNMDDYVELSANGERFAAALSLQLQPYQISHIYISARAAIPVYMSPPDPIERLQQTVIPLSTRTGIEIKQLYFHDFFRGLAGRTIRDDSDSYRVLIFRSIDFDAMRDNSSPCYLPDVAEDDNTYHRIIVLTDQINVNPPKFRDKKIIKTGIPGRPNH